MTDTLSWLAEPESIAFGGYSVVLARGLEPAELVARIAAETFPRRTARPLGPSTAEDLIEEHELDLMSGTEDVALRYGQAGDLAFAVAYGYWQGELALPASVSRGGAEVYHVEYEEENGKPVPPQFDSSRDGQPLCFFNLHLDASWGRDGVDGDPATAAAVTADLAAAGLPDPERSRRDVHRSCLELLGRRFGLALPRAAVLDGELPAVLLEAA
ncbi:hypothetical protein ACFWIQ_23495 [Kitasatospora sp. NPDC127059]|uniref:hypothetical protein n=1 Tax=unclassified Kitasatospora TaxID=2633591 RepID=UPI0036607E95